jgi:hypothetical protein
LPEFVKLMLANGPMVLMKAQAPTKTQLSELWMFTDKSAAGRNTACYASAAFVDTMRDVASAVPAKSRRRRKPLALGALVAVAGEAPVRQLAV